MTLAAGVISGDFSKLGPLLVAQMSGAIVGAAWCGCITCRTGARRPMPISKRACFCTAPAIRAPFANLF